MSGGFLRFESISKSFPGVKALDTVSFGVESGSVHALVGENGAGKSTLLKILSGAYRQDSGSIVVAGEHVSFASPIDAIRSGVSVIYQELHLVPEMSIAENIYLGHLPNRFGFLESTVMLDLAATQLAEVGVQVDPREKVGRLPLALRQMVEIAKALTHDARIFAFDEPTSSLSAREVSRLFEIIERLKESGKAVLYVSHRMDEVFSLCNAITVLRDGKHVFTENDLSQTSRSEVVNLMVGREIEDIYGYKSRLIGEPVLEVKDVVAEGIRKPASLTVRAGEIVGIFGLVGAGRTELLKAIFGANRFASGSIWIDGVKRRIESTRDAIKAGIALCPEDRKDEGIFAIRSVKENNNLSARRRNAHMGVFIKERWEHWNALKQVERLRVRTPTIQQHVGNLSGGNQQKVVLGRWLSENPRVILLDEPTRGIDIGAKKEIYDLIYELAESGVGVVVVSSELPEVLGVCDRILVMREGEIVREIDRTEANQGLLLELALPTGDKSGAAA
ncbi:MAG: L-arabinose ABC transporter ATP-binding protein AraG [Fimbriimonadales bacterium]|nr:L-arabinose ABC transporter ATP-binding protein AraG [Fimbriimonadales bacterium]